MTAPTLRGRALFIGINYTLQYADHFTLQTGMTLPILYSFRRCPYAIRTRLALKVSGTEVELREIVLRNKPAALLEASAKATVPVLVLPAGDVLDESLDIMLWALAQRDPQHWLLDPRATVSATRDWLQPCDGPFKQALDRYKYADRHPEQTAGDYRRQAEAFLLQLEQRLQHNTWLAADHTSWIDMAILPFIRQFALVDLDWFAGSDYRHVQAWLDTLLQSPVFGAVMDKYTPWQEGTAGELF
jgi:glutathione S-transferase